MQIRHQSEDFRSTLDRRVDADRQGGRVATVTTGTHLHFRLMVLGHEGLVQQIEHLTPMHVHGGSAERSACHPSHSVTGCGPMTSGSATGVKVVPT